MARFESRGDELYVEGKLVLRGWESFNGWSWFATEDRGVDTYVVGGREVESSAWYGLVRGFEEEWGSWLEYELDELKRSHRAWDIKKRDLPFAGGRT